MPITQRAWRNATVIHVEDVFTYRNRKDFSSVVTAFRASGGRHLIVDLHEATYMDSSALGLLALTSQQFLVEDRKISLVGPQGTVKQLLGMANIDKMIAVFATEEAAAEARAA